MKHSFITGLLLLCSYCLFAQQEALIKGKIISSGTKREIAEVTVNIPELNLQAITDGSGDFVFSNVPFGNYHLIATTGFIHTDTIPLTVNEAIVDVETIEVSIDDAATSMESQQLPTIALEESAISSDDDGVSDQNISGALTASRDPFLAASSYTFGPLRYQLRGYKRDQMEVYLNGIMMNDVESGYASWNQWGGLNDIFRNQSVTFGLEPGEAGFGGLIGSSEIDATAASQRQQTRISYSASNRTYSNRVMVTHSTGMMRNGWAFSASASKRWSDDGYVPGTYYNAYSYYLGVSKQLNDKSSIHLTTFGAPTSRGKAAPVTKEAIALAGDNYYNPNWGMQDGEVRNSKVNNSFQPTTILSYQYKPNMKTSLNAAFAFQTGYNGNTSLDWYNNPDPRPDYYRYLPSYFLNDPNGPNYEQAEATREYLTADPNRMQIDWNRIYQNNMMNQRTVNGVTGRRSLVILGEDRDDVNRYSFTTNLLKNINEHITIRTGVAGMLQMTESYRKVDDLLGGDYFVNLNQFAERTYVGNVQFNQNDLNNPNSIVKVGDKYSYDYKSQFYKAYWWGQSSFVFNKVDMFLTAKVGTEGFMRDGQFKNGLFPTKSFGSSETFNFLTYAVKGGLTYKIDGRNYLYANGGVMTNAPSFDNTFISPRTRNDAISEPKTEMIKTVEAGYLLHSPNLTGRLSGFVTDMTGLTDIKRFYHDDYQTFVNYVMRNVDMRNLGGELALQAKISPSFSATAVATWMQAFYTNEPDVSIYRDDDTSSKVGTSKVYIKNYYVAAGPQSAYTLGLNYKSPKYWYANVNFNYMDRNYIDINPSRRTAEAVGLLADGVEKSAILAQEKLPGIFTMDVFAGISIKVNKYIHAASKNSFIYINAGVNNILNNQSINGGFEQLRFDYSTQDANRYPNKYFYGYGINYFLNISYKF
ncbi:hypothetical protein F0919_07960 [Taibaiella lutea]|uniref:TonB-dependent receptor n=1 Tax=Taibaiella lutea TaxID=2608001 RepID=A0A5M6CHS3_9BACT|nr:carboxypeptidase-like regulatory domain-containing protein [Taibaiella lutea]KAA5534546.1 hypothetical protein F0919_07960 [Taibaiella lutea]